MDATIPVCSAQEIYLALISAYKPININYIKVNEFLKLVSWDIQFKKYT